MNGALSPTGKKHSASLSICRCIKLRMSHEAYFPVNHGMQPPHNRPYILFSSLHCRRSSVASISIVVVAHASAACAFCRQASATRRKYVRLHCLSAVAAPRTGLTIRQLVSLRCTVRVLRACECS